MAGMAGMAGKEIGAEIIQPLVGWSDALTPQNESKNDHFHRANMGKHDDFSGWN